jgi:hypothetical protein
VVADVPVDEVTGYALELLHATAPR